MGILGLMVHEKLDNNPYIINSLLGAPVAFSVEFRCINTFFFPEIKMVRYHTTTKDLLMSGLAVIVTRSSSYSYTQ